MNEVGCNQTSTTSTTPNFLLRSRIAYSYALLL
jgi:hypothetical protein